MPRVLLTGFCAVPGPRRCGVQMKHVIRALTSHHTVDLLVAREGDQAYVERQGSVRVLRVPRADGDLRGQIQAFQRALKRQLDGADYDVVHCRDAWSALPVIEARERLGYAVVYDLTRSPLGESALDPALDGQYGRDEEACLLAADLVLVPTPAAAAALAGRGRPERVMLSPPGVDVDRFDWEDATTAGPPRIVYAGSIDPGRGVRVLVRAMAAVVREIEARLVLAGPIVSPQFKTSLEDAIRELGLDGKVELVGAVEHEQIPSLLATSTVCVAPAASDLTPNPTVIYPTKLLEYMACKRAIVAPRRDTVEMVVENGREALLFEPGDPIDLARKLLRVLGEPVLRDRLAAAAYERVRREATASAARRALRKAYDVIADRFAAQLAEPDDDQPKIEALDDDFEATAFEDMPGAPAAVDTALTRIATGGDETMEREPVRAETSDDGIWTGSQPAVTALPPAGDDWAVTSVGAQPRPSTEDTGANDDGTPIEGVAPSAPPVPLPATESAFVAGEIDVPTPAKGSSIELPGDALETDTGKRTPPFERR